MRNALSTPGLSERSTVLPPLGKHQDCWRRSILKNLETLGQRLIRLAVVCNAEGAARLPADRKLYYIYVLLRDRRAGTINHTEDYGRTPLTALPQSALIVDIQDLCKPSLVLR